MTKVDSGLWVGLVGILLVGAVFLLFQDTDAIEIRVALYVVALLIPLGIAHALQPISVRDLLGQAPDNLQLILAAGVGLSIWPVAWWLMEIINDFLFEQVGRYRPDTVVFDLWGLEVIQTVVIVPLALGILVFGGMRARTSSGRGWLIVLITAAYVAVLSLLIAPQISQNNPVGLPALAGYFLVGLLASYLSRVTRSFWIGFTIYATFMYANLALLFELLEAFFGLDYLDTEWLTLVLIGAFGTLVSLQLLRLRTKSLSERTAYLEKRDEPENIEEREPMGALGWGAVLLLLLVVTAYTAGELAQRTEEGNRLTTSETAEIIQEGL